MNNDAYLAAHDGAVWRAMSHFGRFVLRGRDAAALLHHLTTNDIKKLKVGQSCEAALVSNKARMLDWLTIWRREDDFLVITSPNRRASFEPHARRFILFRQDIQIEDATETSALWGLFGPKAKEVLNAPATVLPTTRLPGAGVLLAGGMDDALADFVASSKLPQADDETYNILRVEVGLPAAGLELTEDVNPWEAGLDNLVSLHKGCYNGQEVVARLNTYDKVKQRLRGLKLETPLPLGLRANLQCDGKNAGFLSSSALSPQFGVIGLGFVRKSFLTPGTKLQIENDGQTQNATVAQLPFGILT